MLYSFTFTSHIIVTFGLALTVFLFVTILALVKHGMHFFHFFAPGGVPKVLLLLIVPIEVISYFIRPVSLSIRLFANMMAGHTMLKVFAGFTIAMGTALGAAGWAMGVLPIVINVATRTGRQVVASGDLPLRHELLPGRPPLKQSA